MTINEEHSMKKGVDKDILKRLLSYTKGYQKYIALSLILLIFVVGVELARPIIIGVAVDEVIGNHSKEVIEVVEGQTVVSKLVYEESTQKYYLLDQVSEEASVAISEGYDILEATDMFLKIEAEGSSYILNVMSEEELEDFRGADLAKLAWITAIFLGLTVLGLIVNYVQMIILQLTGQKIIFKIRNDIFTHIQSLSVQFFNNQPVGKIVTRVTNDTETLNEMYTSVIVNSVRSVLMIVGIVITMFVLNVKMSLFVMIVLPFIYLSAFLFRRYSRKAYRDVRTHVAGINTFLSEHISGMRIVQIFAREQSSYNKFEANNKKLLKANLRQLFIFSLFRPSMYFIYIMGTAITLLVGGFMVLDDVMTIGVLVIFLQYVSTFFEPIQQLAEQFNILQSAMASAEKIFTLLDDTSMVKDEDGAIELQDIKGKIEFKNVWFAYEKENWVLQDVSFVVQPGETAAFVGATGAGKTSILNLITRYYTIQKGEILIDDIPIYKVKKSSIRKHVGQMLQDVFVFTGNINSNIRLREESISEEEIVKASKYVNADSFISKLPRKYKEKTYERGGTYSAGQRQLLSFARTLAFKPSVLVLDEATANIDTETEVLIQDALEKIMEGRTTLVVAHRLSTIQHADQIIVLHKGKVRERGTHQELLKEQGFYYNLYQLQYKDAI